ncbi:hypothetical protein Pmani_017351 [Petrolisthes manimaculis]|uniref:DDE Tnp4 domain-containing protein n=1 Tax=Petrolisthes manimaculis TaxID=1843537 RepID=A0AAE1UA05_9EUCA|nr:hypothetical protein Pmani_017351 [Petrolisthes manimaculis]
MSQHRIPCNMALPMPPLQDMPGHIALPIPPQQDTDEYYMDEVLINNLKIQQQKKRGRKACRWTLNWRKTLELGLRLAITLHFMTTGEAYKSTVLNFRVGANSISTLVPDTCEAEAITQKFMSDVIVCPSSPQHWKEVASGFSDSWNFHYTIGAIDGKHVAIQLPPNCGSYYYNYKGYLSIVLLALVDSKDEFIYIDIRTYFYAFPTFIISTISQSVPFLFVNALSSLHFSLYLSCQT